VRWNDRSWRKTKTDSALDAPVAEVTACVPRLNNSIHELDNPVIDADGMISLITTFVLRTNEFTRPGLARTEIAILLPHRAAVRATSS
jgi:hypothetical protein